MSTAKYIRHVNLTTGHSRDSYRADVSDESIELMRQHVYSGGPIPDRGYYRLSARPNGKCWGGAIMAGRLPIASIWVALRARCGVAAWREINGIVYPLLQVPESRPPEPWCAVMPRLDLWPGLAAYNLEWVDGYAEHLAWAWLEARNVG